MDISLVALGVHVHIHFPVAGKTFLPSHYLGVNALNLKGGNDAGYLGWSVAYFSPTASNRAIRQMSYCRPDCALLK